MRRGRFLAFAWLVACAGGDDDTGVPACDDLTTFHVDADRDGYGDPDATDVACALALGLSDNADDCDDADATISPDGVEVCDGVDQDCDGTPDDGATDATAWYGDGDGDGLGSGTATTACAAPSGYVANADDCDDVDGLGLVATTQHTDADGDGFGDPTTAIAACPGAEGRILDGSDCDDDAPDVHPGAAERCDFVDTDCDPTTPEAALATWYGADGTVTDFTAAMGGADVTVLTEPGAVRVCAGTWTGRLDVDGVDVDVIGAGRGVTVLTAGGDGGALRVLAAGDGRLASLTLDAAAGATEPAVRCVDGALTLDDVDAVDHVVAYPSAVVDALGCAVAIADSGFAGNAATSSALLVVGEGTLVVEGTVFADSVGTALYLVDGQATLDDVVVSGGSGLALSVNESEVDIAGSTIGAPVAGVDSAFVVRDTTFGAEIDALRTALDLTDVYVDGRVIVREGGASLWWRRTLALDNGLAGTIYTTNATVTLEDVDLDGANDIVQTDQGVIRGYGSGVWLSCPNGVCHDRTLTTTTPSIAQNDFLVGVILDPAASPTLQLWRAAPYLPFVANIGSCTMIHGYLLSAPGTSGPWYVEAHVTRNVQGNSGYLPVPPFPRPFVLEPTLYYAVAFFTEGCDTPRCADDGTSVTIPGVGTTWGFLYKENPPVYEVNDTITGVSSAQGVFLRYAIDTLPAP